MLNSVKKLQIFYAKSPEISLATSPAEQAVHGVLFTFNLRTFGYRLLLMRMKQKDNKWQKVVKTLHKWHIKILILTHL